MISIHNLGLDILAKQNSCHVIFYGYSDSYIVVYIRNDIFFLFQTNDISLFNKIYSGNYMVKCNCDLPLIIILHCHLP